MNAAAHDRDNNFNLIRIVAATMVLASHSFALATGSAQNEPLRTTLGMTFGTIAVDIFFVTSGYLVGQSIARSGSLKLFAIARILRIYPGLLVALFITSLACSIWFTSYGWREFWSSSQTWKYLIKNSTLAFPSGIEYLLPGTFVGNPWSKPMGGSVNSSLWTLPLELQMYVLLAIGYACVRFAKNRWHANWHLRDGLRRTLVCVAGIAVPLDLYTTVTGFHDLQLHLFTMFFIGAALRFVDVKRALRIGPAIVLLTTIVCLALLDRRLFAVAYILGVAYVVLAAAYLPGGFLRRYNRLGDYSYGTYIYAFPVQQAVAYWWRGITPWEMTAVALPVTLLLAVLSWHLVEKKALALKPSGRGMRAS